MIKYGVLGAMDDTLRYLRLHLHCFGRYTAGGSRLEGILSSELYQPSLGLCVVMSVRTVLVWHMDSYLLIYIYPHFCSHDLSPSKVPLYHLL